MNKNIQVINEFCPSVGESARWSDSHQSIFWIDTKNPHLFCYNVKTNASKSYKLPAPLHCIDINSDGELVGIMSNALVKMTLVNKTAEINRIKANLIAEERAVFNDGALDLKGNLWVGTMDKGFQDNIGKLYRITPTGDITLMDEGFYVSNGLGWSPDNSKFYFVDSLTRTIYQYQFNSQTCQIDQKAVFVKFVEEQGFPDGLVIDKKGCLWVAGWASYHIYQYSPHGELINKYPFPAKNLTSCCFGGSDLKTLFVTSASVDDFAQDDDVGQHAGSTFHCLISAL